MTDAELIAALDARLEGAPTPVREAWAAVRGFLRRQARGQKDSAPLTMVEAATAMREGAERTAQLVDEAVRKVSGGEPGGGA